MDKKEIEAIERLLKLATPPPRLYRYRAPNEWTLKEVSEQRMYATHPDAFNDPFEYHAPLHWSMSAIYELAKKYARENGCSADDLIAEMKTFPSDYVPNILSEGVKRIRNQTGIVCLSAARDSIRMWSYYADSHKGVCLGFDTSEGTFRTAMKVNYQNPNASLDAGQALANDASALAAHVSLRKAAEWEFEQEYRIPIGQIEENPRAMPFSASSLVEIRLGAKIEPIFREQLMQAVSQLPKKPKLIQMKCDYNRFLLIEELINDN